MSADQEEIAASLAAAREDADQAAAEHKAALAGHAQAVFTGTVLALVSAVLYTLTNMCLHLLAAELNIRFAYPLMLKPNGAPTIALAVDDQVLAGQILLRKRFRLLGEADLP